MFFIHNGWRIPIPFADISSISAPQNPYQSSMYNQMYVQRGDQFVPSSLGSNSGTNTYRASGMSHTMPSNMGEAHEAAATLSSIHQPQMQDAYGLSTNLSPTQQPMYRQNAPVPAMPILNSNLQGSQPAPYRPMSRYEESFHAARHHAQNQASLNLPQTAGRDLSRTPLPKQGHDVYDTTMTQDGPGHEEYSG